MQSPVFGGGPLNSAAVLSFVGKVAIPARSVCGHYVRLAVYADDGLLHTIAALNGEIPLGAHNIPPCNLWAIPTAPAALDAVGLCAIKRRLLAQPGDDDNPVGYAVAYAGVDVVVDLRFLAFCVIHYLVRHAVHKYG